MSQNRFHEPIESPPPQMHARLRAGLRQAIRHNEAARLSRIGPTEPVQYGRKNILKMFKEFFAKRPTAH
jgi:hypothetical protein